MLSLDSIREYEDKDENVLENEDEGEEVLRLDITMRTSLIILESK